MLHTLWAWLVTHWDTLSPLSQVLAVLLICVVELWALFWFWPLPVDEDTTPTTVRPFRRDERSLETRVRSDLQSRGVRGRLYQIPDQSNVERVRPMEPREIA